MGNFSRDKRSGAASAMRFPPARLAVSLMFLANGFVVGSWAPKIPEFASRLGLSESGLGLMIVVFGVGSLVTMPFVGALVARRGSRPVLRAMAIGLVFALMAITLAPNVASAVPAIALFGALVGGMDVAMNANAVSVEKSMGRAIMSSCHGFWSLGGLLGAVSGGYAIAAIGVTGHAVAATLAALAMVGFAWPRLHEDARPTGEAGHAIRLPANLVLWLIGAMALFSMVPEGAVLDWGALYLRQEMAASIATSGYAFGAFSAAMAGMRFAGDGVRNRLGAVATLRLCAGTAFAGMLAAGLAPTPGIAIAGFALAGLGISNMVPIAFSAAGNLPGLAPGIAISLVSFLGYSGILLAPSAIGFIAEHTGFAAVFVALSLLLLVVAALSGLAGHADGKVAAGR